MHVGTALEVVLERTREEVKPPLTPGWLWHPSSVFDIHHNFNRVVSTRQPRCRHGLWLMRDSF